MTDSPHALPLAPNNSTTDRFAPRDVVVRLPAVVPSLDPVSDIFSSPHPSVSTPYPRTIGLSNEGNAAYLLPQVAFGPRNPLIIPGPQPLSTVYGSIPPRAVTMAGGSPKLSGPSASSAVSSSPTEYSTTDNLQTLSAISRSSLKAVPYRTPSLNVFTGVLGMGSDSATSSAIPSPLLSAMNDVTPLPSPLLPTDSPGPWQKVLGIGPYTSLPGVLTVSGTDSGFASHLADPLVQRLRKKVYGNPLTGLLTPAPACSADAIHKRHRSSSEYIPECLTLPRRHLTVPGRLAGSIDGAANKQPHMRRELNRAESHGLAPAIVQPPTPPASESSRDSADGGPNEVRPPIVLDPPKAEFFDAYGKRDGKLRRWRSIGFLGQGTFSRVMLATNQLATEEGAIADASPDPYVDRPSARRNLVAVKICEHGPLGGANEERIEMSLKRELEILRNVNHPSLVQLRAWNTEPTRAILVLSYCPGGDLFDLMATHRDLLVPSLLRRVFAELVGAISYLHGLKIVHRDIKLENVLVNLTAGELAEPTMNWATYPYSIVTLTDLGLSRRITENEKLETRCGSDDYAAPEVIMGQPYDGRATDCWSLGVILYALLEARLPFDPSPSMSEAHRMRSRTSHRIARIEWRWIEYAGEDGDHEGNIALFARRGLIGAMEITEGLLKRARCRWNLASVAATEWVLGAMNLDGQLCFRQQDEGEEV